MGSNGVAPLAPFLAQHRAQLEGAGVPQLYWPTLHTKLARQLFDAGNTFSIMQVQPFAKPLGLLTTLLSSG